MREVAALLEVHREDGVARLGEGGVGGEVGARAGVRLQVGVLGAEQLLRAGVADLLGAVDDLATAVVAAAGVSLGVLVGQGRAERSQHRGAGEVLAGDELQPSAQPVQLVEDDTRDLGVLVLQGVEVGAPEGGGGLAHVGQATRGP